MANKIICIVCLIFIWFSQAYFDQKNIEIEFLYSIEQEGEGSPILGRIVDAEFDSDNNLYLLDDGHKKIHMYDSEGDFIRSYGSEGRGPGEFTGVGGNGLSFDEENNQICAIDYPGARIVCHSTSDNQSTTTINLQSTTAVRTNGLIIFQSKKILTGSHQDVNSFLHQIDEDGNTIFSFGDFINFESFIHNFGGKLQLSQVTASHYDNHLLVSAAAPNIVKVYDSNLNIIHEFEDDLLPRPWETHMVMRPDRYRSSFYSMAFANQILSKDEYLFAWSEVNPDIPEFQFHLELRNMQTGDRIAVKRMEKNYILGIQRLSDSSAIILIRTENYDYEVHRVSVK
ncbi:MAG: 6-bladed beta-propeller [Candidatus Paceibacterota bacterium]